ncbi:MAG: hypothetical protein GXP62_07940 [Oligoflexia bacterium]|nr:hypothetical protein [Oligoflexia bacterium]
MQRHFGLLFYLSGLWWIVRALRLEEHSAERVRLASARGPVVYVLHARSRMDWLALNAVLNQRRLPLARFTNGIRSAWLAPVADGLGLGWRTLRGWLRGQRAPDPVASGWLAGAVAHGMTSAIFLLDNKGEALASDPMAALVAAQSQSDLPIQLVPIVVVWRRNWERARTEVGRLLLGREERPSVMQKVMAVTTRHRDAFVQAGEPGDLRELLARLQDQPVQRQVRLARVLLRRYLYRESRVVHGPRVRSHRWNRRLVVNSPEVRRLVKDEAAATGRSPESVQAEVETVLDRIAARFSWPFVAAARVVTRLLWSRIYSGVDLRDVDIERIRTAYRDGTAVLVPCHRSHVDYLLISSQLFEHDVMIPHVVAGENLAFFPMGPIMRRMGAMFIRRSFSGDRIFPVIFFAYLRQLIRDEFPVEFFIEGGRSRTGKLLPARLGVLSMVLDAAAQGRHDRQVTLLPVAISYEQIAEETAYARELAGGPKRSENLGQIVKASRVITKRYGRVFMRVGQPLLVREMFAAMDRPWEKLDREARQEALSQVGERLMNRIARNMVVLPTGVVSMALLAQSKRGIRVAELTKRVQRLGDLLESLGAESAGRAHGDWMVEHALKRFLREKQVKRLADEDGDIIQVLPEKRLTLEYYKNGLINYLVGPSLLAAAVRGAISPAQRERGVREADAAVVFDLYRAQAYLLRYEFSLDPDVGLDQGWSEARATVQRYGALEALPTGGDPATAALVVQSPALLAELAELTRNFLESYLLVLRASRSLRTGDLALAKLPQRIQKIGEGLLAVDELRRPEALSLVNLSNAVRAFREEGVIQLRTDGAGLEFNDAAVQAYGQTLQALLR